jgi:sugar (pentulose or hexulose) kinase
MHRRTGQVAEAFHAGPKVLWLRRHRPEVFRRTRLFLQPRDVVLHQLTGEIATDETHANCTLFFDLRRRCWDEGLLAAFDVNPSLFPPALPSWAIAGTLTSRMSAEVGLPASTPVVVGGADSLCGLYGTGVVETGLASENAGSSSTINAAVRRPLLDVRITQYSHVVRDRFATEQGLNTAGAAIAWAIRVLGIPGYEAFAADATAFHDQLGARSWQNGHVLERAPLFFPALGDGERDNPNARAAFVGLSDRHDRRALAYAVAEGVALTLRGLLDILRRAGSRVEELRVSGGGTRLAILGQIKADVLGVPVVHLEIDATALGAAMLAASAIGYGDQAAAAIEAAVHGGRRFEPGSVESFEAARVSMFDRLKRTVAVAAPEP